MNLVLMSFACRTIGVVRVLLAYSDTYTHGLTCQVITCRCLSSSSDWLSRLRQWVFPTSRLFDP